LLRPNVVLTKNPRRDEPAADGERHHERRLVPLPLGAGPGRVDSRHREGGAVSDNVEFRRQSRREAVPAGHGGFLGALATKFAVIAVTYEFEWGGKKNPSTRARTRDRMGHRTKLVLGDPLRVKGR